MNPSQDAPFAATIMPAGKFTSAAAEVPSQARAGEAPREPVADANASKLAARISRVVRRRTAGTIHNLRVEVRREGVFLDGHCASFYAKQLAQQAAMPLTHDRQLTNRIEVQ
ncbi:MAG TPA: BON domain-containing protein [Pirellulales bacterium]|nr:BON domain-containing protein [Pirellulales bacterium]